MASTVNSSTTIHLAGMNGGGRLYNQHLNHTLTSCLPCLSRCTLRPFPIYPSSSSSALNAPNLSFERERQRFPGNLFSARCNQRNGRRRRCSNRPCSPSLSFPLRITAAATEQTRPLRFHRVWLFSLSSRSLVFPGTSGNMQLRCSLSVHREASHFSVSSSYADHHHHRRLGPSSTPDQSINYLSFLAAAALRTSNEASLSFRPRPLIRPKKNMGRKREKS